MSNDAKKTSELNITTGLSANDRIVVLTNPSGFAQTQTISVLNLFSNSKFTNTATIANTSAAGIVKVGNNLSINATSFLSVSLPGPYANDSAANSAGVGVGVVYYDASGNVKIRLT